MAHKCYLKFDIESKQTTLTIQLNPTWTIPTDATTARNPTI